MPPEVPRYLPPSEAERAHTIARQMTPRSTLGATRDAQPVVVGREVARAGARSITSGGAAASNIETWEDIFTLAAAGAQSVTLTYLPTNDRSEDVKLNGVGQTRGVDWTRAGRTVTVLAAMDARANDELKCQYTYLRGLTAVPQGTVLYLVGGGVTGSQPGAALTSPDGITWTPQASSFAGQAIYGVTWSVNAFVAVGGGGAIATSPDGVTWAPQVSGVTAILYAVAWSGSLLVAVGDSGTVLTSPDGVTWTARTSGYAGALYGVCWSVELALWVAVGSLAQVVTSPDGVTWTVRSAAAAFCVAWSPTVGLFVAGGGGSQVLTSPDGVTWTARSTVGYQQSITAITWGAGLYVAGLSLGAVITSPDGIAWTVRTSAVPGYKVGGIVRSASKGFVLVAATGQLATSPDGITWTARSSGSAVNLLAVTVTA